jgi:hypothetical protein
MKTSSQPTDDTTLDHDLQQSAMLKLAGHFHSLATGASQVPLQSLDSHLRSEIHDPQVLDYHDRLIAGAGPLFSHFLASVPYILEELGRVGVALTRLAQADGKKKVNPSAFSKRTPLMELTAAPLPAIRMAWFAALRPRRTGQTRSPSSNMAILRYRCSSRSRCSR